MNYLFDLINDCAGYTEKYYEEIGAGKLSYKQMIKKYRKERDNSVDGSDESVLLGDNHPHCLMVLEGIHKLFRMYRSQSKDQLSVDYLDTLILRLNVSPINFYPVLHIHHFYTTLLDRLQWRVVPQSLPSDLRNEHESVLQRPNLRRHEAK